MVAWSDEFIVSRGGWCVCMCVQVTQYRKRTVAARHSCVGFIVDDRNGISCVDVHKKFSTSENLIWMNRKQ